MYRDIYITLLNGQDAYIDNNYPDTEYLYLIWMLCPDPELVELPENDKLDINKLKNAYNMTPELLIQVLAHFNSNEVLNPFDAYFHEYFQYEKLEETYEFIPYRDGFKTCNSQEVFLRNYLDFSKGMLESLKGCIIAGGSIPLNLSSRINENDVYRASDIDVYCFGVRQIIEIFDKLPKGGIYCQLRSSVVNVYYPKKERSIQIICMSETTNIVNVLNEFDLSYVQWYMYYDTELEDSSWQVRGFASAFMALKSLSTTYIIQETRRNTIPRIIKAIEKGFDLVRSKKLDILFNNNLVDNVKLYKKYSDPVGFYYFPDNTDKRNQKILKKLYNFDIITLNPNDLLKTLSVKMSFTKTYLDQEIDINKIHLIIERANKEIENRIGQGRPTRNITIHLGKYITKSLKISEINHHEEYVEVFVEFDDILKLIKNSLEENIKNMCEEMNIGFKENVVPKYSFKRSNFAFTKIRNQFGEIDENLTDDDHVTLCVSIKLHYFGNFELKFETTQVQKVATEDQLKDHVVPLVMDLSKMKLDNLEFEDL